MPIRAVLSPESAANATAPDKLAHHSGAQLPVVPEQPQASGQHADPVVHRRMASRHGVRIPHPAVRIVAFWFLRWMWLWQDAIPTHTAGAYRCGLTTVGLRLGTAHRSAGVARYGSVGTWGRVHWRLWERFLDSEKHLETTDGRS